jgi:O-antigen/teichoic acid export membrane protein
VAASSPTSESNSALRDFTGLLGRSGTYAISDMFKQAVNFLLLPLYTAYLSKADYGILSVTLAAGAVLEVIFGLALRGALSRLYFDQKDDEQIRAFLGTLVVFLMGFSAALTLVLLIIGPSTWPLLGQDAVGFSPYVVLMVITVLLNNLGLSVILPLFYVRGQAKGYAAYSLSSFVTLTAGTILFVVVLDHGAAGALWGRLIAGLIMMGPTLWILRRNIRFVFRWDLMHPALVFSLPLVPHLISTWILNFSDRLVLGKLTSIDDVGVYTVGYQFGMAVAVTINAINNAWTPWYFRASTENRREHIPAFVTYFVIVMAGLALGMSLFAREIIVIMTKEAYHDAWIIVPLVTLGYFINGLTLRFLDVLLLHKRTRIMPLTTIAAGAANIGFNVLVIPKVGMIGAAYGTVFGYLVRLALTAYYAVQTGPLPFEWWRVGRVCALGLLIGVPGALLSTGMVGLDLAWKAGFFTLYPIGLIFIVLNDQERNALRRGVQFVRVRLGR